MAIPKILGTETEYGIIGRYDPDFDPISRTLLLINSYQSDVPPSSLWDYTQESARFDPQAMSLDEIYDIPDQPDPLALTRSSPMAPGIISTMLILNIQRPNVPMSATWSATKRQVIAFLNKAGAPRHGCSWMGGSSCSTKITVIIRATVTGITKITCSIGIPPFV